jgi:hypothetical protein
VVKTVGTPKAFVDDHRRLMAVQVCELKWLMIHQNNDTVLGAQKSLQAGLAHFGTPHM